MNIRTYLLALHVHGPCFTNPLITVYGFVLGQIAFDLNKPTADQLAIQIRNLALYLQRSVVVSVLHAEICGCVNVACFFLNFCHVVQHETKWPFTHPPNQKNLVSCLMTLQFYLSKLAAHFLPLNFYHFAECLNQERACFVVALHQYHVVPCPIGYQPRNLGFG